MLVIVVYPIGDWPGFHRRPTIEALARTLRGEGGAMLVVEPARGFQELMKQRRQQGRREMLKSRLVKRDGNLWVLTPHQGDLASQTRQALGRIAGHKAEVVSWLFRPEQEELIGVAGERVVVYDCYDEYTLSVDGNPLPHVAEQEKRLLEKCNLVFTSSLPLYERKVGLHADVHYVPNGSDLASLGASRRDANDLPDDLAGVPQPIIGCVGNIRASLDVRVLELIAARRPQWSLAMIGAVSDEDAQAAVAHLHSYPNVQFTGHKPRRDLVSYFHALSVGISPFPPTTYYHAALPNRIMDYLTAGKPAVAYDVECLHELRDLVYLAKDREDFLRGIEKVIATDSPEQQQIRRERMRAYDLDVLAEKRLSLIKAALAA